MSSLRQRTLPRSIQPNYVGATWPVVVGNLNRSVEVHVYLDPVTGLVTPSLGDGLFPNLVGWSNPTASTDPDGTVALPGITFTSELSSGLYRIGAGDVGLAILGVKVAEFTTTSQIIFGAANAYVFSSGAGAALHSNATSGLITIANRVNAGQIELRTNSVGVDTQVALFGATGGVTLPGASLSIGTTPATWGVIRTPNNDGLVSRDAGNTGNIGAIWIDTSNIVNIGGGYGTTAAGVNMYGAFLSIGTTPATAGVIRIPGATSIYFRNAANTANIDLIGTDVTDNVYVGSLLAATKQVILGGAGGGGIKIANRPAFVAADKYLVVDANGNVHVSALGPAS